MAEDAAGPPKKFRNYTLVDGFKWPFFFDPEAFRSIKKHVPQDNDVIIVTYPKCGTTWTAQIVYLIMNKGLEPSGSLIYNVPFLDLMGTEALENLPKPTASRIHLPYSETPKSDKAKYIYVVRNPKDCLVSFYHFTSAGSDFNDFFDTFATGDLAYGDYFDNVMSWYEHRNDPNVLFISYESMQKDIRAAILKMARHIGEDHYKSVCDEAIMAKIIKYSSFAFMKETANENIGVISKKFEDEYGSDIDKWPIPKSMKFPLRMHSKTKDKRQEGVLVRKGIVGDWKVHLSADQSKLINDKIEERFKGLEFLNEWIEYGCLE